MITVMEKKTADTRTKISDKSIDLDILRKYVTDFEDYTGQVKTCKVCGFTFKYDNPDDLIPSNKREHDYFHNIFSKFEYSTGSYCRKLMFPTEAFKVIKQNKEKLRQYKSRGYIGVTDRELKSLLLDLIFAKYSYYVYGNCEMNTHKNLYSFDKYLLEFIECNRKITKPEILDKLYRNSLPYVKYTPDDEDDTDFD